MVTCGGAATFAETILLVLHWTVNRLLGSISMAFFDDALGAKCRVPPGFSRVSNADARAFVAGETARFEATESGRARVGRHSSPDRHIVRFHHAASDIRNVAVQLLATYYRN